MRNLGIVLLCTALEAASKADAVNASVRASGRDGMAFPPEEGNTLRHGR